MKKLIEVKNLTIAYNANNRALQNVNLEIYQNDFIGITGQNGSGKSTLIKAILDLVPIKTGEVYFLGEKKNKLKIGYVPQFSNMNTTFPTTVLEACSLGLLGKGLHPFTFLKPCHKEKALEKLKLLKIEHLKDRMLFELSGGEFQRMLIARALATDPDVLILDEPTASIDAKSRDYIYSLLKDLKNTLTIILVSHDLQEVIDLSTKIVCLNNKVSYFGSSNITIEDINKYSCS